jgi:DNA polymerase-3 subunit delta'
MRFADIRAQEAAVGILSQAVASDKVAHAYLFSGPPGVGKHLAAKALAMTLNCLEGGGDACGECRSCGKIERNIHPDVLEITVPDGKKAIPIDLIRELERRLLPAPHEGRAKVAIIDPADLMTIPAENALLKTLEEPRPGRFLILITSRASSLLATVRSRCQMIRFAPLPGEVVADLLQSGGAGKKEAETAAVLSGGGMELAAAYLSEDIDERIDAVFRVLEGAVEKTPQKGLEVASSLSGKRVEALSTLDLLMIVLSEIIWQKSHPSQEVHRVLAEKLGARLLEITNEISLFQATGFVSAIHWASSGIRNNNLNPQLALEGMLMSMRGQADDNLAESGFGVP